MYFVSGSWLGCEFVLVCGFVSGFFGCWGFGCVLYFGCCFWFGFFKNWDCCIDFGGVLLNKGLGCLFFVVVFLVGVLLMFWCLVF